MKKQAGFLAILVVLVPVALVPTACDSINFATIDWDGDGVPDQNDAFPVDPNENTDSDGDGVGDNSDAFPLDPDRSAPAPPDGPADNANDNAAPPDVGNVNDNQNANDNQNVNDNASPDPPSGGRR